MRPAAARAATLCGDILVARSSRDAVLALAGIFQSAQLVQQLAREGRADPEALQTSIRSVLALDAPDVPAIYGGLSGLRLGLGLLRDKLTGQSTPSDLEMARYVVAMIHLEGVLRRQPEMLDAIRRGIDTAQEQMKFFENDAPADGVHPKLIEKLAELYSQTLSTLSPRIMVSGEHGHLMNPAIAARVRAALLAGIRSAVLWRQLGGRRWQLLLSRGRIARTAAELLAG
jgi:high frequency lysogenization protein